MRTNQWQVVSRAAVVLAICAASASTSAQVGKSNGLLDLNTATEKELTVLPHMTPEIVKTIIDARPFASITAFNTHLLAQKLKQEQAAELYAKAFIHINLNTATREEIMLIPGAGKKMAHEFDEYRPWKTWAQFNKEISKYVGDEETARLAQYCFIPLNVNTATDEQLATIPAVSKSMIEEIGKGKPWKTMDDFQKALGATAGEKEAGRIARYLVVE